MKNKETINIISDTNACFLSERFATPQKFSRKNTYEKKSFHEYLRNLKLLPFSAKVKLYNGKEKYNNKTYISVFDIDVGTKDLQQCADAIMRLRAEYLFAQKKYDKIHFNFTNGFRADYIQWAEGNRIKLQGNNTSWVKTTNPDYSYANFRKYLEIIFTYAGTLSLSKELVKVKPEEIEIGDIFIQGGSPGHAVIVVDLAINQETGEKIFMLAQSYMPAQSIQLLECPYNSEISPWYSFPKTNIIQTPEWKFLTNNLMRFEE